MLTPLEKIWKDVQDNYVPEGGILKDYNKTGLYYYDTNKNIQFVSYYNIKKTKN